MLEPKTTTFGKLRKVNKYSLLRGKELKLPNVSRQQLRFLSTDCFLSTDEEAAASKRMEVSTLFRAIMNIY